jgi:hypothetical protein
MIVIAIACDSLDPAAGGYYAGARLHAEPFGGFQKRIRRGLRGFVVTVSDDFLKTPHDG